jgi:hypothetical protein
MDKAALRAKGAASQRLVAKLETSAFRYFRVLGVQFAARTCHAFNDLRWKLPAVPVHGDPHVEQFVVTRKSYGLEDFDQSGLGPAVVDLVRYAASLHLACRAASWPCKADDSVALFLETYRKTLEGSAPAGAAVPRVVDRVRRKAHVEPEAFLKWAEGMMMPIDAADMVAHTRGWNEFVALLGAVSPDRPASFYEASRVGALEMGLGSALEKKVLFRIRGATDSPSDDLILEARSISPPSGNECVWRPAHGGSLHALVFMARLARRMPEIYGFVPLEPNPEALEFWVQAWDPGYRELSINDLERQSDLDDIAVDAAHQLAGGSTRDMPEPLRRHAQVANQRAFALVKDRAAALAKSLAAEVVSEWERFRAAQ